MADDAVERTVSAHYTLGNLTERVDAAMRASGLTPESVTGAQLAALDQFHSFGEAGTLELMRLAQINASERVLDVGGGVGGPARLLADRVGCSVTVLDLTPEFVALGKRLTAWTRLTDKVTFVCGSALEPPFEDASFDVAWTIHAAMNIGDKPRLYGEIHRVVRPGGRFALFDVLAGPHAPVIYPVPWADDATSSFLIAPNDLRALLASSGFREREWVEGAELSQRFQQGPVPPTPAPGDGSNSLSNVFIEALGPDRIQNVMRNMREGRVLPAMGVFERV